jgi:segregation and condensation protein B
MLLLSSFVTTAHAANQGFDLISKVGCAQTGDCKINDIINEIGQKLDAEGSSLQVLNVAGGVQIATRNDFAPWVRRLYRERLTVRLSPSALETLSIIAYKQPIARGEIE